MGPGEFFSTANERHQIYLRRQRGEAPPWTEDPIFREWRFCNVHREHDKTTAWFRDEVRSKLYGQAAVEATVAFRWFNRIETGEVLKDLLLNGWNTEEARRRLRQIKGPIVTGAFMVNTRAVVGLSKSDGVLWCIDRAREQLSSMVPRWGSLEGAWRDLKTLPSMGPFMAYEVVSDLRWTPVLDRAADINTWASAGPGCARGIGWVIRDNPKEYHYTSAGDQSEMLDIMAKLLDQSRNKFEGSPRWEMREVEHWACEYDKYRRAKAGERMKRRYQ